jgi:hypothetical protein
MEINRNSYHALLQNAAHATFRDDRIGAFSPYKLPRQHIIVIQLYYSTLRTQYFYNVGRIAKSEYQVDG